MKTWAELKSEIKDERNLHGEDFITDDQLLTWANDAREKAASMIVGLKDKYFETETFLALVAGEETYDLPDDIYANKIIEMHHTVERYEIRPIKRKAEILDVCSGDRYKYRVVNSVFEGNKLKFHPASRETSDENVTIFYIRQSQPITSDTDVIDVPIAEGFIKQYILDQITSTELGPMNVATISDKLKIESDLMIEALSQMFPSDTAEEIEGDYSAYDEATGSDH